MTSGNIGDSDVCNAKALCFQSYDLNCRLRLGNACDIGNVVIQQNRELVLMGEGEGGEVNGSREIYWMPSGLLACMVIVWRVDGYFYIFRGGAARQLTSTVSSPPWWRLWQGYCNHIAVCMDIG